jgi:hypothetical protein
MPEETLNPAGCRLHAETMRARAASEDGIGLRAAYKAMARSYDELAVEMERLRPNAAIHIAEWKALRTMRLKS